jgi:NAD(P)-dependent dehydrogenase (short-subunit alcohol dehydrogenase family)
MGHDGFTLKGKVVIITGAASGMGKAAALLFSQNGANVVVADLDETGGSQTTVEIEKTSGMESKFVKTDITRASDAKHCVDETIRFFGKINCLYNNAGINPVGDVVTTPEEVWDKVLAVNLKGMYLMSKYAVPFMKHAGGGTIVCTASIDGLIGIQNEAAYIASKGGVIALTKSMAVDFAKDNIRVNCICPGAVRTPLLEKFVRDNPTMVNPSVGHALGRVAEPEEVARVAMFLLSDLSSFMTGAVVPVDGGYTGTRAEYINK